MHATCLQAVATLRGPRATAQPLPGADYLMLSPEQQSLVYAETAQCYAAAAGTRLWS